MNNTLTSAAANLKNLENQRAAVAAKDESGSTTQIELHGQHVEAVTTLNNFERLHILDQATAAEVEAAQKNADDLAAKLAATERRNKLIKEELQKIDAEILKAKQEIAATQREFCVGRFNSVLREIKSDQKLKSKIIEAMAALAASNSGAYTYSSAYFVQQHIAAIVPEISETEAREAIDQFIKSNKLE